MPVSCRVLTPGHISIFKSIRDRGILIVGLLTKNAMVGYKDEVVPFKDRYIVVKSVLSHNDILIAQDSFNPEKNLKKYKCTHIASGDGFDELEIIAAKKLGIKLLPIGGRKKYSSTKILEYYNTKTRY